MTEYEKMVVAKVKALIAAGKNPHGLLREEIREINEKYGKVLDKH